MKRLFLFCALLLAPSLCLGQAVVVQPSSGGGFTPPVVATQSANGATMETCKRFTDSAPTGNCWLALSNDGLTTLFKVDVGGNIYSNTLKDLNGNPFLIISATASAVDSITITNAATANPAVVSLGATGSDSNISLRFAPKGTGTINLDNQVFVYGKKSNGSLYPLMGVNSSDQLALGGSNQIDTLVSGLTQVIMQPNNTNIAIAKQVNVNPKISFRISESTAAFSGTDDTLIVNETTAGETSSMKIQAVAGQATSTRVFKSTDSDGTTLRASLTQAGYMDTYNGVATAGVGVVPVLGVISSTAQTAAITTATLCSSAICPAGQYEVDVYAASTVTCATPGPGVVAVNVTYTDDAGTKTAQAIPLDVNGGTSLAANMALGNTTNSAVGHTTFWVASGTTQYATTYTACTSGTGTYSLRIAMRRLL